jgi:hypothetical protein
MRLPLQLLLALFVAGVVFASDIITRDGKTYKHAKITAVDPDGLRITHSTGVTKAPFDNLPDDIQKQYHYDPAKVAAWRRAVEEAKKAEQAAQAARLLKRICCLLFQMDHSRCQWQIILRHPVR